MFIWLFSRVFWNTMYPNWRLSSFFSQFYGWLQIKLKLENSQQVRGLVGFDHLPGSNPQDQIKSEIDPCWLLSIAAVAVTTGIAVNVSHQLMTRWSLRWRHKMCIGARSHAWFLVWIRIRLVIRSRVLGESVPSTSNLLSHPNTS